ncbi:MAG: sigma-70 family RNA polymerase sigma factor [Armatimonadetes bacterium]|nr:sigma-70 family RNA polymerase sigma factor [Armatimonadota bacterium]
MNDTDWLAVRFEENRSHIGAVAYRMLGSRSEADDAVQEAWLRLSRADTASIENLAGWMTTAVARVCLDMLRSRKSRREVSLEAHTVPTGSLASGSDPEHEALQADTVGLALLVVLETLTPAERLAFVLHDIFAMPFEDIAPLVERSLAATRQLASRARRRVRGTPTTTESVFREQRDVVGAFLAAARGGNFDALLAVLDPNVVLRAEGGAGVTRTVSGAAEVAGQAFMFAKRAAFSQLALVDGAVGIVFVPEGRLQSVLRFVVVDKAITEIEAIAEHVALRRLHLSLLP